LVLPNPSAHASASFAHVQHFSGIRANFIKEKINARLVVITFGGVLVCNAFFLMGYRE
jgi:hypothetical protein